MTTMTDNYDYMATRTIWQLGLNVNYDYVATRTMWHQ